MSTAFRLETFKRALARTGMGLGLLLVAFALVGCASTQSVGSQASDTGIATKIKGKLAADPEVNPFNVDATVNEGVVRLSGKVEDPEARVQAERLARNTEGVVRVINEIELGSTTIGERVDDAGLTMKIKSKLAADPEINPFNINVDVEDGKVTLMGRVVDERHKKLVEDLVRNTGGVREVVNRLEVGDRSEQ
ncbi:MAG TPA: BON domain-containing protein [Thermoanaerobaculia bacterium]|nr:BON domain-containing protein [Thermoanaerobaculia bacterium]